MEFPLCLVSAGVLHHGGLWDHVCSLLNQMERDRAAECPLWSQLMEMQLQAHQGVSSVLLKAKGLTGIVQYWWGSIPPEVALRSGWATAAQGDGVGLRWRAR